MPLGLSGFIFYTEITGGCFPGLEKDKGSRSQEIMLYVYVEVLCMWAFCLVLPELYVLIKLWGVFVLIMHDVDTLGKCKAILV